MAKVRIKTSEGDILVRLYDETPIHRDNFIKLAKQGYTNIVEFGGINSWTGETVSGSEE